MDIAAKGEKYFKAEQARDKKYAEAHKEEIAARRKEYYAAHRDEILKKKKANYESRKVAKKAYRKTLEEEVMALIKKMEERILELEEKSV